MLPRINQAIGHLKLTQLRPQHLNNFYQHLIENSQRTDTSRVIAKETLTSKIQLLKSSKAALPRQTHLAASTITSAMRRKPLLLSTAQSIARALDCNLDELFTIHENRESLSRKTILEHHRLISNILAQAEKEMLVSYNTASKATPPKADSAAPQYFQPDEMDRILNALDQDVPLHWKAITYLLIDTGCRRGEIMGLKWKNVDLETGLVVIDCALLYSKKRGIYGGRQVTIRSATPKIK